MNKRIKKKKMSKLYKDTWNLDRSIAKFILPRLKLFNKIKNNHPYELTEEEWNKCLNKIIKAFELYVQQWNWSADSQEKQKNIDEGLDLFRKYYNHLWW